MRFPMSTDDLHPARTFWQNGLSLISLNFVESRRTRPSTPTVALMFLRVQNCAECFEAILVSAVHVLYLLWRVSERQAAHLSEAFVLP